METGPRNPMRIFAPVGIVVFGIALILVIATGGGGGGGTSRGASAAEKARDLGPSVKTKTVKTRSKPSGKLSQDVYVVKRGDTLGAIAQKSGVPVQRLQELNPGLDQFSLVAGQRIKLK
jgi:LysM repeat protein